MPSACARHVRLYKVGFVALRRSHAQSKNLRTLTQELLGQKRSLYLHNFRLLLDQLSRTLARTAATEHAQARLATDGERTRPGGPYTIERFIDRIVWLVQEVLTRHEGLNAERFLDDAVYKAMVQVITVRSSPCELRHNTIRHHVMSDY